MNIGDDVRVETAVGPLYGRIIVRTDTPRGIRSAVRLFAPHRGVLCLVDDESMAIVQSSSLPEFAP